MKLRSELQKIIKSAVIFSVEEQHTLYLIVDDMYYYLDRFDIIANAFELVKSLDSPKGMEYTQLLPEFNELTDVIMRNSFMTMVLLTAAFFQKPKKDKKGMNIHKDDRYFVDFLDKAVKNYLLLYKLKSYLINQFNGNKNDLRGEGVYLEAIRNIQDAHLKVMDDKNIIEFVNYRNKILSHHTNTVEDPNNQIFLKLIDIVKYLEETISTSMDIIITTKYNKSTNDLSSDLLKLNLKINQDKKHIIQATVEIIGDKDDVYKRLVVDKRFNDLNLGVIWSEKTADNGLNVTQLDYRYYKPVHGSKIDTEKILAAILLEKFDTRPIKMTAKIVY